MNSPPATLFQTSFTWVDKDGKGIRYRTMYNNEFHGMRQYPVPPHTTGAWVYVLLLSLGSVLAANFLFFAGVKRIDAAPTAVAATIEPVVGTLLALMLFNQRLSPLGWLGLAMVVGGVATGYLQEAKPTE